MIGAPLSRAASREATTVEEEVTFYDSVSRLPHKRGLDETRDGWNGELLLLAIFEELARRQRISRTSSSFI